MVLRLRKEIDKLKQSMLGLSTLVEEQLLDAICAARERDRQLAQRVINKDEELDQMEVEIEEECLKILALHQPVAIDLRVIVAVLKINNDLERIGDLAANIAARANGLTELPEVPFPAELTEMMEKAKVMLRGSIEAIMQMDAQIASQVMDSDSEVDRLNRRMYDCMQEEILRDPACTRQAIMLLSISRYLERIGDAATNIAEDVIYMIEGRIVRHGWQSRS